MLITNQLQQFIARICLLDAGLLEAAHQVASLVPTAGRSKADSDDEEGGEGGGSIPAETAAEVMVRINKYVEASLKIAKRQGKGKDEYKDGLVFEERQKVLAEFARQSSQWKKCSRCLACVFPSLLAG